MLYGFRSPDYVFLKRTFVRAAFLASLLTGCAGGMPEVKKEYFKFPAKNAFVELPTGELEKRPFDVMGWVRARATYNTMDAEQVVGDDAACKNYYNKAVVQLISEAKKAGADAVIKIRSVVFLLDGKTEEYPTAQCSDDGAEGEILLKGVAIKFKKVDPNAVQKVTPPAATASATPVATPANKVMSPSIAPTTPTQKPSN